MYDVQNRHTDDFLFLVSSDIGLSQLRLRTALPWFSIIKDRLGLNQSPEITIQCYSLFFKTILFWKKDVRSSISR